MNVNQLLDEAVRREGGAKSINRAEASDLWLNLRIVFWEATRDSAGRGVDLNLVVANAQHLGFDFRLSGRPRKKARNRHG